MNTNPYAIDWRFIFAAALVILLYVSYTANTNPPLRGEECSDKATTSQQVHSCGTFTGYRTGGGS